MKKILLALIILLFWLSTAVAEVYTSPFGFSIDISSQWVVLSQKEVKENPDLFDFENKSLEGINQELLQRIKGMIQAGKVEFYFNQETSNSSFNDNINVTKSVARLPKPSQLESVCNQLHKILNSEYGRKIQLYECTFKQIGGVKGFYSEFDGAVQGTRSLQYQIPKSPSVVLVITATCSNANLPKIRKEFKQIMDSFQLSSP